MFSKKSIEDIIAPIKRISEELTKHALDLEREAYQHVEQVAYHTKQHTVKYAKRDRANKLAVRFANLLADDEPAKPELPM